MRACASSGMFSPFITAVVAIMLTTSTFQLQPILTSPKIHEVGFQWRASSSSSSPAEGDDEQGYESRIRRVFVGAAPGAFALAGSTTTRANAAVPLFFGGQRPDSLYVVTPGKNLTDLLRRDPAAGVLTSELCLLKLLPVKNRFFRSVSSILEGFSRLGASQQEPEVWKGASKLIETTIAELDNKRSGLEPVFNPDDSAMMQIQKAERGEQLIDALRTRLVDLQASIRSSNVTSTKIEQRKALLALSRVGELLVSSFPYNVPTEGKFSFLPRLLGRAQVSFSVRRRNTLLGNITLIADGYAAPITAGNFVDLSLRNFYTGLPIKFSKKRLSAGSDFEVANIPILGSYNEGNETEF